MSTETFGLLQGQGGEKPSCRVHSGRAKSAGTLRFNLGLSEPLSPESLPPTVLPRGRPISSGRDRWALSNGRGERLRSMPKSCYSAPSIRSASTHVLLLALGPRRRSSAPYPAT